MKARLLFPVVAGCFFLSGAAGLLYEIVWLRLLGQLFGHTVHAVTTVLAAYMGGLALGSLLWGRRADRSSRPILVYALLEGAIGAYCLATPLLFGAAEAAYLVLHRALQPTALGATALQATLSAALLLPPTTLMGATLPFLSRAVAGRAAAPEARVGLLYSVNTWGAVAGTAASGFLLLPLIGLRATTWLGVALNFAVAAAAALLHHRVGTTLVAPPTIDRETSAAPAITRSGRRGWVVLAAIGISGAASLAYEIAWTRALSLVLGSSTYAFSAMLTTFLVGLALGAFIVSRVLRRWPLGLTAFAVVECAIALLALALVPLIEQLPDLVVFIFSRAGLSHQTALLAQFCASFAVMLPPTLAIGATFPLAVAALGRGSARVGEDVGRVYGASTLGTIAGSATAGFVLMPALGMQSAVVVAAGTNVVAGLALLLSGGPSRRKLLAAGAVAVAFGLTVAGLPRWNPMRMVSGAAVYAGRYVQPGQDGARSPRASGELLFYEEGLSTTVSVTRAGDEVLLAVNGKTDASNGPVDMRTQLLLGHLPALIVPEARRALVIGLGSGITAGALAQHPLESIDVAELEPAVVEAARFFAEESHHVLDDPRLKITPGDGRHILAAAERPYDIIVSEPSNPWIAGVANLFTREFYREARARLSERGVFVQWLQAYAIFPPEMRMVVRTFQEEFPDATIWRGGTGDYLLVSGKAPLVLDEAAVARRLRESEGARADLARYWGGAEDLIHEFVLSAADARRYAEGALLNTDDLPLLEYAAPRALYASSDEENDRLIQSFRRDPLPAVAAEEQSADAHERRRVRAARAAWLRAELDLARALLRLDGATHGAPAVRVEAAVVLLALGQFEAAVAALQPLEQAWPSDDRALRYLAAARYLAERAPVDRVVQEVGPFRWEPKGPGWAYHRLGKVLFELGVTEGAAVLFPVALEQFEAAARFEPRTAAFLVGAGKVHFALDRAELAEDAFRRAVTADPRSADAHFFLGLAEEARGRAGEARLEYEEAARLAPSWSAPREKLAELQRAAAPAP